MIIEVTKNGGKMGVVNLSPEGKLFYIGEPEAKFKSLLETLYKNELERLVDIPDKEGSSSTIVEQRVMPTDSGFSIALKEYLERIGYEVTERQPEIDGEITELLAIFSADNQDKNDILKRLSEMSLLEKTTVLEGLRALNNPDNKLE